MVAFDDLRLVAMRIALIDLLDPFLSRTLEELSQLSPEQLIDRRYPIYAEADVTIDSGEGPPDATASRAIAALGRCERVLLPPEPESAA